MRILFFLIIMVSFVSCITDIKPRRYPPGYGERVWGNKPIYSATLDAKQISYIDSALPVNIPGNIYAKGNRIYQLEIGRGIHVIENADPSQAHRIGFIRVNGSSQISIKDNNLYTNSYDDLLVIDISVNNTISLIKRMPGAFPDGLNNYYYIEPVESGFFECPVFDSVVVGWRKDSIWASCYKN